MLFQNLVISMGYHDKLNPMLFRDFAYNMGYFSVFERRHPMLFRDFDFSMGEFFVFRALAPHVISQICILAWGTAANRTPCYFKILHLTWGIAQIEPHVIFAWAL